MIGHPNRTSEPDVNPDPIRSPTNVDNERTDEEGQDVDLSGSFAERADTRDEDPFTVDQRRSMFAPARHPVIRTGERDPIPAHVRSAVFIRDHGKCHYCGHAVEGPWHLDHIFPWSAGGSDDSTNLRVLCERHNIERSNYYDPFASPRTPATWWCVRCYSNEGFPWVYINGDPRFPSCLKHRVDVGSSLNTRCGVIRGYRRWFELHGEFPDWHMKPPIDESEPLSVAFCAHCYAPGLTSRSL